MKLVEIMLNDPRDEYNDNYIHYFDGAGTLSLLPGGYVFKKAVDDFGDVHYGIFDYKSTELLSYLHLTIEGKYAIVGLPSTAKEFRGQGLMSYMYNYAVLKDHLILMSDNSHTPDAKRLWKSLQSRHLYKISVIDLNTKETHEWDGSEEPWIGDKPNIRLVTEQYLKDEIALQESYTAKRGIRANRKRKGMDDMGLYGPGTSTAEFWNP